MPHKDWCGKPCAECASPCGLDESIPCSPDCPNLSEDGMPSGDECRGCDAADYYASESAKNPTV